MNTRKLILPTLVSIVSWSNGNVLVNDICFLFGNPALPYIFQNKQYYYFRKNNSGYELIMLSDRDLESFS